MKDRFDSAFQEPENTTGRDRGDHPGAPQTAAAAIVEVLREYGVDRIFGIPGGPISPVIDATLDAESLEFVSCQHETMAMYAAAGYARATGQPGVVAVTSGPGALNALTGLAAALLDESPLILLVGEVATSARGRCALQDGTDHGLQMQQIGAALAKRTYLIERPWAARARVAEAIQSAMQRPYGPSLIRIPVDVGRSLTKATQVSLATEQLPGLPSAEATTAITHHLHRCERGAIMLGGRAHHAGCGNVAKRLAERCQLPVFTDLEAKGLFPESHPLSLGVFGVGSTGRAEGYLEQGVDFLMMVGARLDDTTTGNFSALLRPSDAYVVQIDYDSDRLARSYEVDLAVRGDPRVVLTHLLEEVPTKLSRARPISMIPRPTPTLGAAPFDPRDVPSVIQANLPEDTLFTSDIGNHLVFAAQGMRFDHGGQFHASLGLGGMGSGIGMAIGLSLGQPQRRVVNICGDGGLLMAGNELATCVRHGVDVTYVVFNDGQWGMVAHGSDKVYGRSHDWNLPEVDIVGYAKSLGAQSVRIESQEQLEQTLQKSRRGTWVLDVPIDPAIKIFNPRDDTLDYTKSA